MSTKEANDMALLLRAGALAAPMEIIEERTIGPSLGADNITQAASIRPVGLRRHRHFMVIYYLMFGVFSVLALACQRAVAGGAAVHAAGDADPAGHGRVSRSRWAWRSTPTC